MARSSIGQDTSLSRMRAGFDSPSGYKFINCFKLPIWRKNILTSGKNPGMKKIGKVELKSRLIIFI